MPHKKIDELLNNLTDIESLYVAAASKFNFSDRLNSENVDHYPSYESRGSFLRELLMIVQDMKEGFLRHGEVDKAMWCRYEEARLLNLLRSYLDINDE